MHFPAPSNPCSVPYVVLSCLHIRYANISLTCVPLPHWTDLVKSFFTFLPVEGSNIYKAKAKLQGANPRQIFWSRKKKKKTRRPRTMKLSETSEERTMKDTAHNDRAWNIWFQWKKKKKAIRGTILNWNSWSWSTSQLEMAVKAEVDYY